MPSGNLESGSKKIFVLDTSVILYDHFALFSFEEHDVVVPIQVLEELDNFKSGDETRNFEARSFIRLIENTSENKLLTDWISLPGDNRGSFRVILDNKPVNKDALKVFGDGKTDHRILNAALSLQDENQDKKVILVSKDICLRLKAKALDLHAEDYETGKIKNVEELYSGKTTINDLSDMSDSVADEQNRIEFVKANIDPDKGNHFYILDRNGQQDIFFHNIQHQSLSPVPETPVFNVFPRNAEQACAIHALLNPDIKLVTIQGNAGTGKTLLALASALQQRRDYRQIFITRPIVPLSNKDIGFLPGDIKSKVDPYMAPIWDNLKFIKELYHGDTKMQSKLDKLIETEKIAIAPLAFIRGRTLAKIFFIVDEAQNLTPHEIKTIISRAGEDTKIVFTGDIYQIDTPYLEAESNGLSYLIDRAKNHPLYAHITLQKGERSELANLSIELL
jgi:PhoH-like ATPase